MRSFQKILCVFLFISAADSCPANLCAQTNVPNSSDDLRQGASVRDKLFDDEGVLTFKLTGKLNSLFNDRNKNVVYHPMLLQYTGSDSSILSIRLKLKTRGNFRLDKENCSMPPLMLNFAKSPEANNTIFENQSKLKLVVPCKGDEYVIREWLVYKLFNLISEKSFKARLVQVTFEDSLMKRKAETRFCFLLEDESSVARRNNATVSDKTQVAMRNTDAGQFLKMAVFQFMIGNTDWSVPYLQNIKLITTDTAEGPYPVPYDFDHAGIVSAPYAFPAPALDMQSVVERRYRGYCLADKNDFKETFILFNKLKDDFYRMYLNCKLLSPKYVKFVTKYLNDFYATINNDKAVDKEFQRPCYESTRVEIKGLKAR